MRINPLIATMLGLTTAVACAAGAAGAAASSPPPIVPPPGVQMHRVGYPVQVTNTPAAYVGQNHIYEVATGTPPQLVELNPDGSIAAQIPLTHGYNAWAVTRGNNGMIYTAVTTDTSTKTGYLYAWRPGTTVAHVVATIPNTVTVWSLSVDPVTGIIWIGAQGLYSYNPSTNRLARYGTLQANEHDVHAVSAYDNVVYAGLTPYTEVVRFTPATDAAQVLQNRAGQTSGVQRVFAPDGTTLQVLWASGAFEVYTNGSPVRSYYLNGASTTSVGISGQEYTFLQSSTVAAGWDYGHGGNTAAVLHRLPSALVIPANEHVVADGEIGGQLIGVMNDGEILSIDPTTWQFSMHPTAISGTPGIIHAIYADQNGSIWTSVYLGGEVTHVVGHAFTRDPFPYQVDGLASYGGVLYLGSYPGGWLYAYDESKPWDVNAGNPRLVGQAQLPGPQQDRTYAIAAGAAGVYLGTIPTPGYLGGDLGYYNPKTARFTVFNSPVQNEAVTSLAYAQNGMLVGTTTTFGGGNVAPLNRSGRIFVWNPGTQSLVGTYIPEVGMAEWGGLVVGPDGVVYGANPRAVFAFDPTTGKITVRNFNPTARYDQWSSLTHMVTWQGRLFLLSQGELYQVDPRTLSVTKLFYGAEQMAVSGPNLYLSYHNSVALESLPLSRLTPRNSVYPAGYITYMDKHPNLIP